MPKNETDHVEVQNKGPFDSLDLLCKSGVIPDGERAYKVLSGDKTKFVVSNSPAQASLSVATAERVSDRELASAAMRVASGSEG